MSYNIIKVSNKLEDIYNILIQLQSSYKNIAFISYINGEYGCRVWLYNSIVRYFVEEQKKINNIIIGICFKGLKFYIEDLCDIIIEIQNVDFENVVPYSGQNGEHAYYSIGTRNIEYETMINNLSFSNIFYTTHHNGAIIANNVNSAYVYLNDIGSSDMVFGKLNNTNFICHSSNQYNYFKKNKIISNKKNDTITIAIRNTNKHSFKNMTSNIYENIFKYCIENKKKLNVFMDLNPVNIPESEYIKIYSYREQNQPMFDIFVKSCKESYIYIGCDSGTSEIASAYTNANIIICNSPGTKYLREHIYCKNENEIIDAINKFYI